MVKEAHRKIKARRQTELLAGKDLIWLMWLGTFLSETSVELSVHSEPLCICWAGGRHGARWSSPATTSRHMTGWWELNQQIQRCDQVEEIYGICKASIGAMDHRNLTAAMYRLAKLKGGSLQSRRTRDEEHEQVCRMIVGSALEQSNVDLSQEFINMILASTGYSAASRVITTTDELITQLLALGR